MPSRIGPAPSQLFPVTTSWRHSRVCARGGEIDHQLTRSIDGPSAAKCRQNVTSLPQNPFSGAFTR
jgi:hypothetical protein